MKKKTTLLFGVLASLLVVSLALPFGYAGLIEPEGGGFTMLKILTSQGCCDSDFPADDICWVGGAITCDDCCDIGNAYDCILDRKGCGCCIMPPNCKQFIP